MGPGLRRDDVEGRKRVHTTKLLPDAVGVHASFSVLDFEWL